MIIIVKRMHTIGSAKAVETSSNLFDPNPRAYNDQDPPKQMTPGEEERNRGARDRAKNENTARNNERAAASRV